jgi:hypothetical protein
MRFEVVQVCRRPQWPLWAILLVFTWLALGGCSVLLSLHLDRVVTLCVFKWATGLPCPTCGLTRGTLCLLRGRPDQAWLYNPLVFSVLVLLVAGVGLRILFARSIKIHLSRTERVIAWLVAGVLFAVNWAYVIFYVG